MAKVTTIAECDIIDKKYGRGKFAQKVTSTADHKKC